jgi:membrane-bound serine protease (ClpP class)
MQSLHRLLSILFISAISAMVAYGQAPPATAAEEPGQQADSPPSGTAAAIVVLDGDINDYTEMMLERRFQQARDAGAATIILEIDTYGGYVHSGQAIARFLKRQQDLHVIAYVPVKAISAGAMIAVAANEIVMEPGSQIGNSGVVTLGGQDLSGTNRAKAESMVIEEFYDSAIRNGYDPLLLESMVVVERVVHFVEHVETRQRRFVNAETYKELMASEQWRPVPNVRDPLDAADTLLTLGADLAQTVGLAREVASDQQSFIASRGYVLVIRLAPGFGDQVVAFLNGFAVRGLLTTVLLLSLYMSFSSPGQGLPEVAAVVALGVLLGVPLLTGYATWVEIVAVLLGLVLIAMELFIIPGFGPPGITGLLLVLGGLTMTFAPPVRIPDATFGFAMPWGALLRGLFVVMAAMTASLMLWWWLSRYLPSLPYFHRLVLTTGGPASVQMDSALATAEEVWPKIGAVGRVVTDLRPGGTAEFPDELIDDVRTVDVVSDAGFVGAGEQVKVREVHGNRVVVRPV